MGKKTEKQRDRKAERWKSEIDRKTGRETKR
jgi:hypothetical protein